MMNEKVFTAPLPSKDKTHTYYIASDWHDTNSCEASINILIKMARKHKQQKYYRRLIINGDFLDLAEFMERSKNFKKWVVRPEGIEDYFLPAANRAIRWGNKILDCLQKTFGHIVFISGNHDWRLDNFGQLYAPDIYKDKFNLEKRLKFAKRGILHVPYNNWYDIGKMSITHGMYHGTTCLKRHYEACGRSVIFGHVHQVGAKSFVKRGDSNIAYSLPCMCDLAPDYLKARENNWTKGFGVLNVKSNGKFNFNTFTIWDGELVLPSGEIIKG